MAYADREHAYAALLGVPECAMQQQHAAQRHANDVRAPRRSSLGHCQPHLVAAVSRALSTHGARWIGIASFDCYTHLDAYRASVAGTAGRLQPLHARQLGVAIAIGDALPATDGPRRRRRRRRTEVFGRAASPSVDAQQQHAVPPIGIDELDPRAVGVRYPMAVRFTPADLVQLASLSTAGNYGAAHMVLAHTVARCVARAADRATVHVAVRVYGCNVRWIDATEQLAIDVHAEATLFIDDARLHKPLAVDDEPHEALATTHSAWTRVLTRARRTLSYECAFGDSSSSSSSSGSDDDDDSLSDTASLSSESDSQQQQQQLPCNNSSSVAGAAAVAALGHQLHVALAEVAQQQQQLTTTTPTSADRTVTAPARLVHVETPRSVFARLLSH